MSKYKMLTHGGYEELENCIGKTVQGTRVDYSDTLIHIPLSELIKAGAIDDGDPFDTYLFCIDKEVEEVIE